MRKILTNKIYKQRDILLLGILFFSLTFSFLFPHTSSASMLSPGEITTCGELGISGEYILMNNLTTSGTSTCFSVSSDNVTINGNGHTITGNGTNNGSIAIDARARAGGPEGVLDEGMNGYTNLIIANLTISNFTIGVNTSGNGNTTGASIRSGNGGDGGDVAVSTSTVGSIYAMGGDSTTVGYGGTGGNVYITNDNINISNTTFDLRGGTGTSGRNTDGGLTLLYSGTLSRNNITLSPLAFLKDNATTYTNYPGGTWPVAPSTISSCGTLAAAGTYILSNDIGSAESPITSTCFTIGADDVTIDGGGHTIYGSSTDNFFIEVSTYGSTTLASTTVTGYSKLINSTKLVTITSPLNLDISNQYIKAGSLAINYTGTINFASTTISALTNLTVNGTAYGVQVAGVFPDGLWSQKTSDTARQWRAITSSADGIKLAAVVYPGYIYTSTNSGVTWVQRTFDDTPYWSSITSDASGTKLAAVVNGGYVYTSIDGGITWSTKNNSSGGHSWWFITSSADGNKLVAFEGYGNIYTSTNSGNTWVQKTFTPYNWASVASDASGTKLAIVGNGSNSGYIYVSTDSGNTWVQKTFGTWRNWSSITSSADGTKLAAVYNGGYIYVSTDSGNTWVQKTSDATRGWYSITSSTDGTKLAAVASGGYIYTSTDSGNTWVQKTSDATRPWQSITSDASGNKLAAVVMNGYIYTSSSFSPQLNVDILSPLASSTISIWSPYVSWGTATQCYYSYDNFVSSSTAVCANNGSDIPRPASLGTSTLSVRGIDAQGTTITKQSTFTYNLGVAIIAPTGSINTWSPSVNWNVNNVATSTLSCYYSYNNFTSTSTADCSLGGSDIVAPNEGPNTLYVKVIDQDNNVAVSSVGFALSTWVQKTSDASRAWKSITSSADGTKLAAVVNPGYIYTSVDSGNTWFQKTSDASRAWKSITSSADGTKLAAVAGIGYIYTSTDSGNTWVQKTSDAPRNWASITSSADCTKLAAVDNSNGYIYTSTDFGETWTARTSAGARAWYSITSSADGNKLAAAVYGGGGYVYTSSNGGATWTERTSPGSRQWQSVASSADGTKLALVGRNTYVYVSADSGATWTAKTSLGTSHFWYAVASDASGTKLAIVDSNPPGYIYTSMDSGNTWVQKAVQSSWSSITSSADGNKLAAATSYIYTATSISPQLNIHILFPFTSSAINQWSPYVSWGTATQCYYSYDNFTSTSTADCSLNGSDIPRPSPLIGSSTLSVRGIDAQGTIVTKQSTFTYNLAVFIISPSGLVNTWSPSVNWNVNNVATSTLSCYYSYNNFTSTSTADCSLGGSDIVAPNEGPNTLYVKVVDQNNNVAVSSVVFELASWTKQTNSYSRKWQSITSSADGTKLAAFVYGSSDGYIYTSGDSGVTWTQQTSSGPWIKTSITSSADGNKLAVTMYYGSIYTSADAGVTWVQKYSGASQYWKSITSDASGTKLAAVVYGGYIYTSTDSGNTWVQKTSDAVRNWYSITSDASGTKLAAVVYGGYIYTSIDSGDTWVQKTSDATRNWRSITSSADGIKLAAVVYPGYIYTSIDSGDTWVQKTSDATRNWRSITSSADGTKLAAVVYGGYIYTSENAGATWVSMMYGSARYWYTITSSADGIKLAVAAGGTDYYDYIYTYASSSPQLSVDILSPLTNSSAINQWSPYVSWGTATQCYYSYDNFVSTSTANCALGGVDISRPSPLIGTSTLSVKGIDAQGIIITKQSTFRYDLGVFIISPARTISTWSPDINWNVNSVATSTLSCYYSYDNFTSTSTADCSLGGADVTSPPAEGSYTLYVKVVDQDSNVGVSSVAFSIASAMVQRTLDTTRQWYFITSSADGTKLAAIVGGTSGERYIYTSTDSGITWSTKNNSSGSRRWQSITSDASGTKLAAVVYGGYIYTSTDSGNTWVQKTSDATRGWYSITSDASGTKLAAVFGNSGYIYTSIDSGNTWVQKTSDVARLWFSITSSADGTKLAAVVYGGYIYTSTDSGNTWIQKTSGATRNWYTITSSADGTKLATVVRDGYIYTSTDSGSTWATSTSAGSRSWYSITSSADGTKLAAVVSSGYIYTSTDSGNTWVQKTSDATREWRSITSSADGTKLAAVVYQGYIYTSVSANPHLSVDILTPVSSSSISSWTPIVSWGTATQCYYSYDNFVSTSTANCSLLGSDISAASYGTSTLSVKGIDASGTIVTNQSTFFFPYYVWCGDVAEDNNWSNPNNWYTSPMCSDHANAVPDSGIYAALIGSTAPVVNTNTWTMPARIDSTGLTSGANTSGVIFTGTSTNSVLIIGNATFNDSTHNTGTITGSATFNTSYFTSAIGGTLTIPSGSSWSGTVGGTVYGSDNLPITNYIFNGNASNLSTINGTAVFNNSSNNNGTINGAATFNNTAPFTIGTVNGTVTLNGFSQVLSGVNNVTNFVKQLAGGVRDTLYLLSGSTLNISGLTTILGGDASNLLTIRTTTPNAYANLGINGTNNLNNLRIKDINNTGPLIDLTNVNVYDDGGNTGFTFKPNSAPSQRSGGIAVITYTPPAIYVPPARNAGNSNSNNNSNRGSSGSSLFDINNNLGKLSLKNLPKFSFGGLSAGSNLGTSKFVNPLTGLLQLQPIAGFEPLPKVYTKLQSNISNFFNSSLPKSLANLSNTVPSIKKELTSAGIINGYDLYSMKDSPVNTPTLSDLAKDKTKQPTNLIFTSVDDKETPTKLSIDKKGRTYQILTVEPNDTIDISIKNTNKTLPITIFDNNPIKPNKDKNNNITLTLNAPTEQGTRILTVGDLTLEIRVKAPAPVVTPKVEKKLSPIKKMWNWFTK